MSVRTFRFAGLAVWCLSIALPAAAADDDAPGVANVPPEGFQAVFNGEDLGGWIGLPHYDPRKFRAMSLAEREKFLADTWAEVVKHWTVENGELVNDGEGPYLTTARDYGDFELRLDYKTVAKADSGIYLRGNPQVQIWDWTEEGGKWNLGADKGSGALWNNQTHARFPLALADRPFGEWNALRIKMVGDSVTVHLNDKLVVNETVMENFWDRGQPVFPLGPIQLQTHGGEIRFRNVFIKEIPRKAPESGHLSKAGEPYGDGWKPLAAGDEGRTESEAVPRNFDLHAVFSLKGNAPAEVAFRADGGSDAAPLTLTVSPETGVLLSATRDGASQNVTSTPAAASGLKAGGENHLYLRVHEDHIQAWLNGTPAVDVLYPHGAASGHVRLSGLDLKSAWLRNAADDPRVGLSADEAGFEPIFNGKDLSGWTGDTAGYVAEPGVLKATAKGGNLYYEPELSDFALRFDFKFDAGANNGVGVRTPIGGHAASEGVEVQILDNTSDQYAGIAPWQAHGSVYGVVPAKRGYLAPVGHWNWEEITVEGGRYRVVLNGKVIVDADARAVEPADGKPHPSLAKPSGHVAFMGHGHEVAFRDVRVRRLGPVTAAAP